MILKKYIDGIENDLKQLGCKAQDFSVVKSEEDGIVIAVKITFRDTPFCFTIRKHPAGENHVFTAKYVAYVPPHFKEKDINAFLFPDSIKDRLRNWIQREINVYLEELEEQKVLLIPEPTSMQKGNLAFRMPKFKMELGQKIALASFLVALIVLLFGNNIIGRIQSHLDNSTKVTIDSTSVGNVNRDSTVFNRQLPFLENVPILDKGLFIKHYFNDFILGGINIDTLSINARTKNGEVIIITKISGEIKFDIAREPFIEFEYKGVFYSIEVLGNYDSFASRIRKDITPTLKLKKIQ